MKVAISELEIEDIIYVNKQHSYCSILDIIYTIGGVTLLLEHCYL